MYKKYEKFLDEYWPSVGVIDFYQYIKKITPAVKKQPISPYVAYSILTLRLILFTKM